MESYTSKVSSAPRVNSLLLSAPLRQFDEAQEDEEQRGWAQMKSWFETGSLKTVVQEVFPWTEAKQVQELLAGRGVFGKLVMEVH